MNLIILSLETSEITDICLALEKANCSVSRLDIEGDIKDSFNECDLILLDMRLNKTLWGPVKDRLPRSIPCIGLFNKKNENLAFEHFNNQYIQEYLLIEAQYSEQSIKKTLKQSQINLQFVNTQSEPPLFQVSHSQLHDLVNMFPQPFFVKNRSHQWILFNQAFADLFGKPVSELFGKSDFDFFPKEEAEVFWANDEEVFTTRSSTIKEESLTDHLGETHTILTKKNHYNDTDGQEFLLGSITNIDHIHAHKEQLEYHVKERTAKLKQVNHELAAEVESRKVAEEKIKASLKEKDILLKEIYHRVKNNLQVISSILNLQSRKAPHPKTRSILKETQNRVLTMALVHEKLYESGNLAEISFGEYIQELGHQIAYAYGGGLNQISLDFEISDPVYLNIDTAIPCGLIINELLTNAYQHAFISSVKDEVKRIDIRLKVKSDKLCEFIIQDNGVGLSKDFDFYNASSLGLRLVNSLAHQIDGNFSFASIDGTCIILDFPIYSDQSASLPA